MRYFLGIDCGSVSMKAVIMDENIAILKSYYTKNHGLTETVKQVLSQVSTDAPIYGVGVTGSGRELISLLIGGDIIESEIISHYIATTTLFPSVRTIFDIGGEDCKLLVIDQGTLTSFSMNRDCGGGTGAMIESIAYRMGIQLDMIGETALKSKARVIIPSKCGIFAQSSVVSKLNKGVPKEDIMMGICRGLVGNYFTMLAKGMKLQPPYIFQGATAKNKALVKCFEEELMDSVTVPGNPELMGALGVALLAREESRGDTRFKGFDMVSHDFSTKTFYGKGCTNECEITAIFENGNKIGHVGNRCEKCVSITK
jgi:predicted CoA-substrate-specific enzyme activase